MLKRKSRFKPLYKKFINLRENPQNRSKFLKFRKKKWENFIKYYKKKLKWYKKYKLQNQNQYIITKYTNKYHSYSKNYTRTLKTYKNFTLFYGNLKKKIIRNQISLIKNKKKLNLNLEFLKFFERRIDVILYRAKFCYSLRNAQQLIIQGKVLLNNRTIKHKSFIVKPGDLISIKPQYFKLIESYIALTYKAHNRIWPIPPKHLFINYNTMQIILGDLNQTNLFLFYPSYLNLEKILNNFYYQ